MKLTKKSIEAFAKRNGLSVSIDKATNWKGENMLKEIENDWYICNVTGYGKTSRKVVAWCPYREEYIDMYHQTVEDIEGPFASYEEAKKALEKMEEAEEKEAEELEKSATEEEKEEYDKEKSRHEANRNSYYGYCNGNRREFSKMYGDGDFHSLAEWLKNKRA